MDFKDEIKQFSVRVEKLKDQISTEEATKNALAEAALTIKNIKSIYVKSCKAKVENNKIVEYRALVKIAFVVQREK